MVEKTFNSVEYLEEFNVKVERAEKEKIRAETVFEEAKKELKEKWGCSTPAQAKKKIEQMEKELQKLENEFNKLMEGIKSEYGEKLESLEG